MVLYKTQSNLVPRRGTVALQRLLDGGQRNGGIGEVEEVHHKVVGGEGLQSQEERQTDGQTYRDRVKFKDILFTAHT